jgi:hypothetical protein
MANKYLTGNEGSAWLNGTQLAELKKIESKITLNFEETKLAGAYNTEYIYTGWTGEGTLTLQKRSSTGVTLLAQGVTTGDIPTINIITKLTDKATGKSERYNLTVLFSEFALANFENAPIEEELPFKITDYTVIETI